MMRNRGKVLVVIALSITSVILLQLQLLQYQKESYFGNTEKVVLSAAQLQNCLDVYTAKGSWLIDRWIVPSNNHTDAPSCPSSVEKYPRPEDVSAALRNLTIGFMGDSTTRSDLRAWEEYFHCPRTNLDEAQVFQRKNADGSHICTPEEQSINLAKCGVPPIINMTNCTSINTTKENNSSPSFRYFYKIYPWTPLDEWYFTEQPHLFSDLDALVISVGRWIPYLRDQHNVTHDIEQFIRELKKVYSGIILFQSQYAEHTILVEQSTHPVNCTHGLMIEKYECEQTITVDRPKVDDEIRSVVVGQQYHIPYLDRWNISKSLPIEHYETWLCGKPEFHSWYCDHHLSFVAMEHLRLVASVVAYIRDPRGRRVTLDV